MSAASPAQAPGLSPATAIPPKASGWRSLSRWQAFTIHFVLSLLIFATLVALMVMWWFPGELFLLDGGWQGLKLVAVVDLVLGPALTLILWSPKKPSLGFDMCFVAAFQIAALTYGFITTYDQRTVAMVMAENTFVSLSNADLEEANGILLQKDITPVPLSEFTPGNPVLVLTPPPDMYSFGQYLEDVMNGFPEARERNDQYIDIADGREDMKKSALDRSALESLGWLDSVQREVEAKGFDESNLEFYKFAARYAKGVAMFDTTSMKIVDYLPLKNKPTLSVESLVD